MKIKLFFLGLILSLNSLFVQAQNLYDIQIQNITIVDTTTSPNLLDTVIVGHPATLSFEIVNNGSDTFFINQFNAFSKVYFNIKLNDSFLTPTNYGDIPNYIDSVQNSVIGDLLPGSFKKFTRTFIVPGGPLLKVNAHNEVVIWPRIFIGEFDTTNNMARRKFYVSDGLAINNIKLENAANIYPVPTSQYLTIDINANNIKLPLVLEIVDISGRVLYNESLNSTQIKLDVNQLNLKENGNYIINLISDKGIFSRKFMIQK